MHLKLVSMRPSLIKYNILFTYYYILFAFLQSFHKDDFAEIEKVKSFFFDEDSDLKEYFESVKILLEGIQSEFYRSLGNTDNTNSTEVKETKSKKKTLP